MSMRPITTPIGKPTEVVSLELMKEFVGFDPAGDADQDNILQVLRNTAIEHGQQITGITWAATEYLLEGLSPIWLGGEVMLPITPVLAVSKVEVDGEEVAPDSYHLIPSCIEVGRPWARLVPLDGFPAGAEMLSVTCTVGWSSETLPDSLRSWALVRIATLYDQRADLVTGTITASMPRHHTGGLLDRYTVRSGPYDL